MTYPAKTDGWRDFEATKSEYPNYHEEWTKRDSENLIRWMKRGDTPDELARTLQRPVSSIKNHVGALRNQKNHLVDEPPDLIPTWNAYLQFSRIKQAQQPSEEDETVQTTTEMNDEDTPSGNGRSTYRQWTPEEERELVRLKDLENEDWDAIVDELERFDKKALMNKHYNLRKNNRHEEILLDLKHDVQVQATTNEAGTEDDDDVNYYTEAEENMILDLRENEALTFREIAKRLPADRSPDAVCDKYHRIKTQQEAPETPETDDQEPPMTRPVDEVAEELMKSPFRRETTLRDIRSEAVETKHLVFGLLVLHTIVSLGFIGLLVVVGG